MGPVRAFFVLLLLAAAFAAPARATMLYKSVNAKGVVEFSDLPPGPGAKIIEERVVGEREPVASTSPMESLADDDAVAGAAMRVDLAEHALALARRGLWSPTEGLRLRTLTRTPTDEERIEFYKRNVLAARKDLLKAVKQRLARAAGTTTVAAR